jgi:hypothetical protein
MAFGDPKAGAYHFVIESKNNFDAFIQVLDFEGFSNLDLRYKLPSSDKWTWLRTEGDVELSANRMTTKEGTDAEIDRVLDLYNDAINKFFGNDETDEPTSGLDRVRWLLKNNGITEKDNVLTRT